MVARKLPPSENRFYLADHEIHISASIGISYYPPTARIAASW